MDHLIERMNALVARLRKMASAAQRLVTTDHADEFERLRAARARELPDLADEALLAEAKEILVGCQPGMRTPSSARMRRVLRATVRVLEEKQQAGNSRLARSRPRDAED